MDGLWILLLVLFGVVSCSHGWISGSVSEVTVRPGDSITLYCDCKLSSGAYKIAWFRNCSHENQPSLVLNTNRDPWKYSSNLFNLVRNQSSQSYDLLIRNITDTEEGFYYCGTEQSEVVDKKYITPRYIYRYGKITTRIILNPDPDPSEPRQCCDGCWTLLFCLCPALAVLSSLLSSLLVYHLRQEKAKEHQVDEKISGDGDWTSRNLDEDVCYSALKIHLASQRPKKKKTQDSDFSTYSAINTCRM